MSCNYWEPLNLIQDSNPACCNLEKLCAQPKKKNNFASSAHGSWLEFLFKMKPRYFLPLCLPSLPRLFNVFSLIISYLLILFISNIKKAKGLCFAHQCILKSLEQRLAHTESQTQFAKWE